MPKAAAIPTMRQQSLEVALTYMLPCSSHMQDSEAGAGASPVTVHFIRVAVGPLVGG